MFYFKSSNLLPVASTLHSDQRFLQFVDIDSLADTSFGLADVHSVVHVVLIHHHRLFNDVIIPRDVVTLARHVTGSGSGAVGRKLVGYGLVQNRI